MDAYLIGLSRDYVDLVDRLQNDSSLTYEERQTLDSERQVAHRQLCQHTGRDLSEDMYRYCKAVLHAARGGNYQ